MSNFAMIQGQPRHFGWQRPKYPVKHNRWFHVNRNRLATLPRKTNNRALMVNIPVEDQQNIGSCGPNSQSDDVRYDQAYSKQSIVMPSRLFVYWITRERMGTLGADSGVSNTDMMAAIMEKGFCPETMWTYENVDSKFLQKPPDLCFTEALKNRVTETHQIPVDLMQMKAALAQGIDFVVGFTVYESFESIGPDGVVPIPKRREQILGGHDNLCVDFDDDLHGGSFITRNPWGPGFGDKGYLYFPYAFLASTQYGDDYWAATTVSTAPVPPQPNPDPTPTPTPGPWTTLTLSADLKAGTYKITP